MAIPKKGSRKIIIDGYEFVWKFRKRMGHNERHGVDYLIPVQYMDGQILLISTGYNRSDFYIDHIFSVTPSIIEKCIRFAVSQGWQFKKKLPALEIDCRSVLIEEAWSNTIELIQEIEKDNQDVSKRIAKDATELVAVGEYQIALENMVSNICEYDIELEKDTINLARVAFCIWKNYEYLRLLKNIRIKQ